MTSDTQLSLLRIFLGWVCRLETDFDTTFTGLSNLLFFPSTSQFEQKIDILLGLNMC